MVADWPLLSASLLVTLKTTLAGSAVSRCVGGVALAVLLSLSRVVEYSLYPIAVVLQVTPVIAIAPLLLIYLPAGRGGAGLRLDRGVLSGSVEHHARPAIGRPQPARAVRALRDARVAERIRALPGPAARPCGILRRPAALPAFLAGLRIAGGLSLIGAVVAEMAAGSAGAGSGLAYRIIESQYRLNIPRLFAALVLLAAAGIVLFLLHGGVSPSSSCAAGTRARWMRNDRLNSLAC